MNNKNTFSGYKNGVESRKDREISTEELVEEIKNSETLKEKTVNIRSLRAELERHEAKFNEFKNRKDNDPEKIKAEDDFNVVKKKYKVMKKGTLPLITIHAYFEEGRTDKDPHTYNNLILADIDHIPEEEADMLLIEVKKCSYVLFANKSVSGKGIHVIVCVNVEGGINDENFKDVFKVTTQYVDYDLNIETDKTVGTISRCMFLNYDKNIYYNPEAIPLDMTGALWLEKNSINNLNINQDMNQQEKFSKYCAAAEPHLNWNKGTRNKSLVSLAYDANRAGFEKNVVIDECVTRYAEPDFDDKEIKYTISYIYKKASSEHGINQKTFTPKKDKKTKGHSDTPINKEEDLLDEDELLTAKYPDVEEVRQYIPAAFYDYIIDNNKSKEINFTTLISVLVAMGTIMKGVKCLMKWGEVVTTFIYYIVCGAAASGKSCIGKGYEFFKIHAEIIENESKEEIRKKEEEHKKWEKCQKNCKEEDCGCGVKPIVPKLVRILLSLTISASKLIHQLFDNGPIPSFLYTTELDSYLNIKENPLSPALRAGYEGETVSSHTHMHGDVTKDNTQMSVEAAGTPLQAKAFFQNKENGLVSRFIGNFLPDLPYEGLKSESNIDYNAYINAKEAFRERAKTFIKYALNLNINLILTQSSREEIDAYFEDVEKRYASYNSPALQSFIRRLRKMDIRLAMILTVLGLYDKIEVRSSYDIPDEIIKLMISWNDFWIEQHIRLLSLLPDEEDKPTSNELKYAHVYKSLPCDFDFSSAKAIFNEKAGVSDKTAQRTLKTWVKKELLTQKLQRYYKTDCKECPPQEQTPMC